MPPATPTRERLVTEAMRLFSTHGYQATSISQIECAAGLTPGSGALYHHFKSKESLLQAGIDRQLDRRRAMADIRGLFAGLGNLEAELTVLGRYLNTVITQESELLQIAARTPPGQSAHLDSAYHALIEGLTAELTDWIKTWEPTSAQSRSELLAELALNSILGARLARGIDEQLMPISAEYLTEWAALLSARIHSLATPESGI